MHGEIPQQILDLAWQTLQKEGGLSCFEKRNLIIPKPDLLKTLSLVGLANAKSAYEALGSFTRHLNGQPIIDRFGSDHYARRDWRTEMEDKVGLDIFNALYRDCNQLRVNKINAVFGGLYRLKELVTKNSSTSTMLIEIESRLDKLIHDDPSDPTHNTYNQKTIDEKLRIVQKMEDGCIEVLKLFAR